MIEDDLEEKVFNTLDATVEQLKNQYDEDSVEDLVTRWANQF